MGVTHASTIAGPVGAPAKLSVRRDASKVTTVTRNHVLVLTMGRVGSTAAFRAVEGLDGVDPLHIHHLHPRTLASLAPRGRRKAARHVQDGYRARELIEGSDEPVKVITLVRDVVERNLSVGFARLRRIGPPEELAQLVADPRVRDEVWGSVDVDLPDSWFDVEIRDTLGIDVFARRFPPVGHQRFTEGRYDLLVMRSDLPDVAKSGAVSEFLGLAVAVRQSNSRTREGGQLEQVYDRFRRSAPLTDADLRKAAESPLMQHFFAVDPEDYVSGWRRRLGR